MDYHAKSELNAEELIVQTYNAFADLSDLVLNAQAGAHRTKALQTHMRGAAGFLKRARDIVDVATNGRKEQLLAMFYARDVNDPKSIGFVYDKTILALTQKNSIPKMMAQYQDQPDQSPTHYDNTLRIVEHPLTLAQFLQIRTMNINGDEQLVQRLNKSPYFIQRKTLFEAAQRQSGKFSRSALQKVEEKSEDDFYKHVETAAKAFRILFEKYTTSALKYIRSPVIKSMEKNIGTPLGHYADYFEEAIKAYHYAEKATQGILSPLLPSSKEAVKRAKAFHKSLRHDTPSQLGDLIHLVGKATYSGDLSRALGVYEKTLKDPEYIIVDDQEVKDFDPIRNTLRIVKVLDEWTQRQEEEY